MGALPEDLPVLVSGVAGQVAEVAAAIRQRGGEAVEVADLTDLPAACTAAGPAGFGAYVQLAASFSMTGETAIARVRTFYADGVLARFTALDAALGSLRRPATVVFVLGTLPPEVTSTEDRNARRALTEVLAHAARADTEGGDLLARILGADTEPDRIAAFALGQAPPPRELDLEQLSLADWRVELLSIVTVET